MWGISLSGPLPIVVLVSRYLTNKLIGRMPIFYHRNFLLFHRSESDRMGYYSKFLLTIPPVKGRLHTRYAPVRRSSADCKQSLLPLDLHVLSLPLAFILSQDQTLRCCFLIYFHKQLKLTWSKWFYSLVSFDTRCHSLFLFFQ